MSAVGILSGLNSFYIPFTEYHTALRITGDMLSEVDFGLNYLHETGRLQGIKKQIADSMKIPIVDEKTKNYHIKIFIDGLITFDILENGILSFHNIRKYFKHINLISFLICKNSKKFHERSTNLKYLLELRYRHLFSYNYPPYLKPGIYSEYYAGVLPLQAYYRMWFTSENSRLPEIRYQDCIHISKENLLYSVKLFKLLEDEDLDIEYIHRLVKINEDYYNNRFSEVIVSSFILFESIFQKTLEKITGKPQYKGKFMNLLDKIMKHEKFNSLIKKSFFKQEVEDCELRSLFDLFYQVRNFHYHRINLLLGEPKIEEINEKLKKLPEQKRGFLSNFPKSIEVKENLQELEDLDHSVAFCCNRMLDIYIEQNILQ